MSDQPAWSGSRFEDGPAAGVPVTDTPLAPADAGPPPDGADAADAGRDLPELLAEARPADGGPGDAELAALVRRIVYQDEAALAALYRRLCGRVYRHALRLMRDPGTAEEVVEDVFWQVWRQAPRFDAARAPVLAWVLQIARSRALDALRARGRNPLYAALDVDGDGAEASAGDDGDPQARLAGSQLAAQIEQALRALDPLRRQLVALAFQRGYSQAEIAEQTGLPLGTVKSHLRRALATMKQSLEPTLRGPRRPA